MCTSDTPSISSVCAQNAIKTTIATWEFRTVPQKGKLVNIKQKIRRTKIDILGIIEVRWQGVNTRNDRTILLRR